MTPYRDAPVVAIVGFCAIRAWSLWNRAVAACRKVPSWNIQLWDVSRTAARLVFPGWPKNTLGDLHAGFRPYDQAGSTALAVVALETLSPTIWFSNAEACFQILEFHETRFRKDLAAYELIMFHGPNIIASEGEVWKRHRHASRVSFSEKSYALIWKEAGRTLEEWFDTIHCSNQEQIEVDAVASLNKVTLNIIASAGFGQHFPWKSPLENQGTSRLPFSTSVIQAIHLTTLRAVAPSWAYSIPIPILRRTKLAYDEMERHLTNMIQEGLSLGVDAESVKAMEQGSLLRGLLQANHSMEGNQRLSDRELLSNIYVFLIAGHETSAHALAFVLGIFALYPNVHARVREEADSIWPRAHVDPTLRNASSYKEDYHRLKYTLAVLNETMRHFPAEPVVIRKVGEDAILPALKRDPNNTASHTFDQSFNVPVSKGDYVVSDIYALHMNTHYWGPNTAEFDPTRFLDPDWPKHAFMPFSSGPRACLGRGFAQVEAVRIIATVAQDWDIRCKDSLMNMPWESRKNLLLRWNQKVTMTPIDIKLMFKKRAD